MSFVLQVLLPGLLACLLMAGLLSYLGMHVLAREVIFVDIALAQIAALGAAVAGLLGAEPDTPLSYACALGFTIAAAALFAATRALRRRIPQEAFIGIAYAMAAAAVILVANASPHGDEQLEQILVGSLLTVQLEDVAVLAAVFAVTVLLHIVWREPFRRLSFGGDELGFNAALWDFLFYVTFAVVITFAVDLAGVLLVFSFLIVPAVFSALFARRLWTRLLLGWALGAAVSAVGLYASFSFDLPSGAAVVITFGAALLLAAVARGLLPWRDGREPERADAQS